MNTGVLIASQLLLAHVLTDFVFQSKSVIQQKRVQKEKSIYLYFHAFLAGLLTYLFLQQWQSFFIPILVTVSHYFIDLWKLYKKEDNLRYFLLDQLFHVLILFFSWLYLTDNFSQLAPYFEQFFQEPRAMIVVLGYLIVVFPVNFIIGKATSRWQPEINEEAENSSLAKAGRYIGIFERILVLTFVLTHNIAAIGFLIAAKSILRFSDKSKDGNQKQTEYVLIGTLMSFSISIVIGFLMLKLL